ncbi:MAG: DUF2703 domain-containing protein [Chloroflexi bacterium]|nr:DUF2703 domain-containing protein [Chloroflexota bacterium]
MLTIDFLYYEGCPSHDVALDRLNTVLDEVGLSAQIHVTKVETDEQAQELRFPGSPTIRVEGQDIDPPDAAQVAYTLTCRAYRRPDGRITPLPTADLIRQALLAATQP